MTASPSLVVLFGTRPELIKLAPLLPLLNARVWYTGQHDQLLEDTADTPELRHLLQDVWKLHLTPDPDPLLYAERVKWRVARTLQSLPDKPDYVLVQGDTSSAYGGALGATMAKIPVIHLEAGIRSHDLHDPWPEERFRVAIDGMASLHFAPTEVNRQNLLQEGIRPDQIHVTGQTGLDGLPGPLPQANHVLITLHRRETLPKLPDLALQLNQVAKDCPDLTFLWPAHRNPEVQRAAQSCPYVQVVPPMGLQAFRTALRSATLVLTDSGGIQEEAADLGIPCLVARNHTDRPEANHPILGTSNIETPLRAALHNPPPRHPNPIYGDGQAAPRIASIINQR